MTLESPFGQFAISTTAEGFELTLNGKTIATSARVNELKEMAENYKG